MGFRVFADGTDRPVAGAVVRDVRAQDFAAEAEALAQPGARLAFTTDAFVVQPLDAAGHRLFQRQRDAAARDRRTLTAFMRS